MDKKIELGVQAPLWMQKDNQNFLGHKRIKLLEQIDVYGSLSTAAKAVGMSYKAAWDALNIMNHLAEKPLTLAATGGSGGGGTVLTDAGREVIQFFKSFEQEHQNSLTRLKKSLADMNHYLPLLQAMNLRISTKNLRLSTKNLFAGIIIDVICDAPVAQVVLQLNSGQAIYAVISHDSVAELQLHQGGTAYALVKASSVMISNTSQQATLSARNIIHGKISRLTTNTVLGEIALDIGGGDTITSTITRNSVERLKLKTGDDAWAVIKSSSVIIGVDHSHSLPV